MVVHKETITVIERVVTNRYESVYNQRGDAQWLTGKEVAQGAADGTVAKYYELQRDNFVKAGAVEKDPAPDVSEYVLFDDRLNWIPNGDDFNEDMFRDLAIWGGIKGEYIIDVLNVYPITRNAYSHTSCSITQVRHIIHGIY